MNYQKIHNQIIERAITENRKKGSGVYYELHHIIPRCMGGNNDKDNLVLLTGREHFIVHKLLVEIYPDNDKLVYAYWAMCNKQGTKERIIEYNITSREYEHVKKLFSVINSKKHKGRKHSDEHRRKNSLAKKGRKGPPRSAESIAKSLETRIRNGKLNHSEETKAKIREKRKLQVISHSAETRKKISESNKGNQSMLGKHHSNETKKKISKAHIGKAFYKIECPHCKYIGGVNNMYKWHFDNCKKKK